MNPLQLEPNEKPPFTFCESTAATSRSLWHIRKTTKIGPKFGGGIDTDSLCGHVKAKRGWHLEVRITKEHLGHCCPKCAEAYPQEIFGQAWDLLVKYAGAVPHAFERDTFIRAFLDAQHTATEWRFGGLLGFGGKFWRNDGRYYISCYPEDRTKKREAIIEKVNKLLAEFPFYEPRR